jgi:hypothetical protein
MTRAQPWYIGERAEALARVYLTRRPDLLVKQEEADYGVDYIVEITKNKRPTRRMFGVLVKARIAPIIAGTGDSLAAFHFMPEKWMEEIPFPLCLFGFTMENDEGFYQWVVEPSVTDDGPKLHLNTGKELSRLDNAALDRIITQVNHWYDVLLKALAA